MLYQREVLDTPHWWQGLDEMIERQRGENPEAVQTALIPVLHYVQDCFGYIPPKAVNHVAQSMGVPTSYVCGVASFYSYFSLEPRGAYTISVCLGTACFVRGAQAVLDEVCRQLEVGPGETTDDLIFTVSDSARCLGACGQAPVMMIDDDVHANVQPQDVQDILAGYIAEARREMQAREELAEIDARAQHER
ncbi:MAG: NAD(P)H-dependent oxidoreductase subunit E [Armatimonadota bacterium]|jgi:NADH:ubiquinone oxidoreductase subunit E